MNPDNTDPAKVLGHWSTMVQDEHHLVESVTLVVVTSDGEDTHIGVTHWPSQHAWDVVAHVLTEAVESADRASVDIDGNEMPEAG